MTRIFVAFLALLLSGPALADHLFGNPANCPDDISGSWQSTNSCADGIAGVASVSIFPVDTCLYEWVFDPISSTLDVPILGPVAVFYYSDTDPNAAHVSAGGLTGNLFPVEIEAFFIAPRPIIPGLCAGAPVKRITSDRQEGGQITQASAGIATEIQGAAWNINQVAYPETGPACPEPIPDIGCNVVLLRNSVVVGPNTITPMPGVTLDFDNVTAPGSVLVGVKTTALSPLPSNFQISGLFFEITTFRATFTPSVSICITYQEDPVGILAGTTIPEASIEFLHDPGTGFADVTTSRNPVTNEICGSVDSFSFVAIGGTTQPSVPALSTWALFLLASALLAIGIGSRRARRA